MIIFIEYPPCSTCKKAKQFLKDHNVDFITRHIVEETPKKEELRTWIAASGLPIKRFFNTSGQLYREFQLKDRLETMLEDEKLTLLSENGMLIKRPLLIYGTKVLVGFKETEYKTLFKVA